MAISNDTILKKHKSGAMDNICQIVCARFPALQHQNFRRFLAGQSISLIGTWMQRAAQQWVVYEITKSPFILGLVGVFQYMPMLLFSVFAGVYADRFPKRKFLLVIQVAQMLQAFVLAGLLWSGNIQYWHIFILAAFLGLTHTFDMPTRQSFFIELVEKEDLVSAIGLNSSIVNVARIIGPAVGGFFLSYFGAAVCFFVNGISFVAVIISLHSIKSYNANVRDKGKNILHEVTDGLKYMRSKSILLDAILLMLVVGIVGMNSDIIIPVFAHEVLQQQAGGYSLMLSAMGVGALIGSLIFASRKKVGFDREILYKSALLLSVFLVITSFVRSYYISLFSLAAVGLCSVLFMATVNSIIQLNTSDEYRGRAMGIYTLVFTGTTPIGNLFTGIVMQQFGASAGFLISGVLCAILISALIVVQRLSPVRAADT